MVIKKVIYSIKINDGTYRSASKIETLLDKMEKDIEFWEQTLIETKDKIFRKKIKKLIKDYNNAFKQVFDYKE